MSVLEYARRFLTLEGFRVETAATGKQGLNLARLGNFDVIVLDQRMPDMPGLDVLRTLNAEGIRTRVMMLTGFGNAKLGAEATRLGAAACYDKPLVGDELVEAILRAARCTGRGITVVGEESIEHGLLKEPQGPTKCEPGTREQLHLRLFPEDAALLRRVARERGQTLSGAVHFLLRPLRSHTK